MAYKRAVDLDGLVHAFRNFVGTYGIREAKTYCGYDIWEEGLPMGGWRIVPNRPVTCLACVAGKLTW